ncbi:MAG: DUF2330 domain-containing protein [Deltaproteobacteria bacterium]|nr:DUF2330 domain-containing protein [Deltaproteobacteria bacterium]
MPRIIIVLLACVSCLIAGRVRADRAAMPLDGRSLLSVPRQQAIIGWNGQEELLILGTDRRASMRVKVLEILPLPSEPTIWKADAEIFETVRALMAERTAARRPRGEMVKGLAGFAAAGEITKHRRIGAHDIRVVQVQDADAFVRWSREMLRKWGAKIAKLPQGFRATLQRYLADGYTWFVYDIVELGPETETIEAIGYRFLSEKVYFPLRVSMLDAGESTVDLFVISDQDLTMPHAVGQAAVTAAHAAFAISAKDQRRLDGKLAGMFPGKGAASFRAWTLHAKTRAFTQDLNVTGR